MMARYRGGLGRGRRRTAFYSSLLLLALLLLAGCGLFSGEEVLIAIRPENIPLLSNPGDPDLLNTGIPSLDDLNRRWEVEAMLPLYPDVSPDDEIAIQNGLAGVFKLVLPPFTDVDQLIEEYEADAHVAYAEYNEPATAFEK
jgi:hypothetical protein